jgi:hypothetical protein
MDGRLEHAIEIVLFSFGFCGLAWLFAVLVKFFTKKQIGSPKYYSSASIAGALVYVTILSVVPRPDTAADIPTPTTNHISVLGLDAPFIAPSKDKIESFVLQLNVAVEALPNDERAAFSEAIAFLTYAAGDDVKRKEPEKFARWGASDVAAHSLVKMYNFAAERGDKMTLREYINLATSIKKQVPTLAMQYAMDSKQASQSQ